MRKKAIAGVLFISILFIGVLTLGSINTYARSPGDYVPYSDEKVLDLSKPENLARLTTGKWEGTWQNLNTKARGELLQKFSVDPKAEEKPIVFQTKRRPAGILGSPERWGSGRGTIEGGKVVFAGTRFNGTVTLSQRADGTLVLRGESQGFGESAGTTLVSEQYKLVEGKLAQFFPGEKGDGGSAPAAR